MCIHPESKQNENSGKQRRKTFIREEHWFTCQSHLFRCPSSKTVVVTLQGKIKRSVSAPSFFFLHLSFKRLFPQVGFNIIISITEKTNKKAEAHSRELTSQFSVVTTTLSSTDLCAHVQEVLISGMAPLCSTVQTRSQLEN